MFIVKQLGPAGEIQHVSDTAGEAVNAGAAWLKDGPVFILAPNGNTYPWDLFRNELLKNREFGLA